MINKHYSLQENKTQIKKATTTSIEINIKMYSYLLSVVTGELLHQIIMRRAQQRKHLKDTRQTYRNDKKAYAQKVKTKKKADFWKSP